MSKKAINKFKAAVEATPAIAACYKTGLTALGSHSVKISLKDTACCDGSVEIDECVKGNHPNANRWDYCLSYNDEVYFVEVHSANTSEVSTMLNKLQWLKDWLNKEAPKIAELKARTKTPYWWIMSGSYNILPNSRQARQIAQVGLKPVARLSL